jgi:hypothetical protein
MNRRALIAAVATSIALSLAGGGMLAWVLIDPQRLFGADFIAKTTAAPAADATDAEKQRAITAVLENLANHCDEGTLSACARNVVGAERLATGLWRIVLARHGNENWCLTARVGETGIIVEPDTVTNLGIPCASP